MLLRLLFVIDGFGSGGAQRQMVNLARGMKCRGHDVEFFTYYPENFYRPLVEELRIPVHVHTKRSRFSLAPLFALRRLVTKGNYSVIVSFLDTPNFYAEIARLGVPKTGLIVSERFMYPAGRLPLQLRLMQQCHRLADAITVNSHHQRLRMIKEFPWMTAKLSTIYNGVDLQRFAPKGMKRRHSLKGPLLVAIGTIVEKKNPLGLAKAVLICRVRYNIEPRVRWAGKRDATPSGRRVFDELSRFLEANNLHDNWEWLGERTDVPDLLCAHDALVHPAFSEGAPNVVCEALSSGCPVLVSRVCDHSILVEDSVRGFLFDPHSPESIAEAIVKFDKTPDEQRRVMAENARRYAIENLSVDRFTISYESLFTALDLNRK